MKLTDLDIVFVTNFYDMPLAGLCHHNGELKEFTVDYDTEEVTIIPLTFLQKCHALWHKKLFEVCVGTHQTYKNGERHSWFYYRRPEFLHKLLIKLYYNVLTKPSNP